MRAMVNFSGRKRNENKDSGLPKKRKYEFVRKGNVLSHSVDVF